jgi:hypothetical protein
MDSNSHSLLISGQSYAKRKLLARNLKDRANSYKNERNPVVVPVLATNLTLLSEVASDSDLMKLEREVYFMTRDRLKRLLEEVKHETSGRTGKYLSEFLVI